MSTGRRSFLHRLFLLPAVAAAVKAPRGEPTPVTAASDLPIYRISPQGRSPLLDLVDTAAPDPAVRHEGHKDRLGSA